MFLEEATNITLLGAIFGGVMGLLTLVLPRRYALLPLCCTTCYMTLGQKVNVETINFTMMRIMIVFGWARIVLHNEIKIRPFNEIDKLLVGFSLLSLATGTILESSVPGFINRAGFAFNALGVYFFARCWLRTPDDTKFIVRALAVMMGPLALAMLLEQFTAYNLFSVFGGVPAVTVERAGRLRSQGPFAHPILAGTLGVTLIPLFAAEWFDKPRGRVFAAVGTLSGTCIAIICASSGPVMAYVFVALGFLSWHVRAHMRLVRWSLLVALIGLIVFMRSPVWFLIGRLSHVIGGTGWHRSLLIDEAVKNIGEWWFIGTLRTAHWADSNALTILPADPNMVDITNQFIYIGVNGGLFPLILFVLLITACFRRIGRALALSNSGPFYARIATWALGVALLAHLASFLSVVYFDQMIVIWYLFLAMIAQLDTPKVVIDQNIRKTG